MPEGFEVNNFEHMEAESDVTYGIYDTQDNCWIGDDKGPILYTRDFAMTAGKGMPQELLARMSAQITCVQMGWAPTRLRALEFTPQELHLKDEIPVKMSGVEAIRRAENGQF